MQKFANTFEKLYDKKMLIGVGRVSLSGDTKAINEVRQRFSYFKERCRIRSRFVRFPQIPTLSGLRSQISKSFFSNSLLLNAAQNSENAEFRLKTENALKRASLLFNANIKPMGKQPQ